MKFAVLAKNSKVFFTAPFPYLWCGKESFGILRQDSKFHEVDLSY